MTFLAYNLERSGCLNCSTLVYSVCNFTYNMVISVIYLVLFAGDHGSVD